MEQASETVELGFQFGAAALMMVLITIVHGVGLEAISSGLRLKEERLEKKNFDLGGVGLMSGIAVLVFALHVIEICIFAVFFVGVDALSSFEEALYYSASAYATLGRTADYFPDEWRLLGAIEALIGFLMIGWTTAFMVNKVNKLTSK